MQRSVKQRSAMTNGTRAFLRPVHGNSEAARRFKDVLDGLLSERGGSDALTVSAREACRTYAGLVILRDRMHADLAEGAPVEPEALGQLGDRMSRQLAKMGPVKAPVRQSLADRHAAARGTRA